MAVRVLGLLSGQFVPLALCATKRYVVTTLVVGSLLLGVGEYITTHRPYFPCGVEIRDALQIYRG